MWPYATERVTDDSLLDGVLATRAADGWRLVAATSLANGEGLIVLIFEKAAP